MMTESQNQQAIMKWSRQPQIREKWPELALLHHIPNGGKRDAIEAKHLKSEGVKSGVPDLHLPVAKGKYHGLFIELKTEKGRASEAQKWWINKLNSYGNCAIVCYGWQNAVDVLEWYLEGANDHENGKLK